MIIKDQKKLWNKIAPEWNKFRQDPKIMTPKFLEKRSGNILDLGSGSGRYLRKQKDTTFYLVDFSKEMIKLAKAKAKKLGIKAEFHIGEADKLPFKNNFFDAAICIAFLHCVKGKAKRKKVLRELYRVMKPGAKAKFTVWNKETKRFKNSPKERFVGWKDIGKRYYYLYSPEEFYDDLESVGFKLFAKPEPIRMIPAIIEKPKK